MNGGHNVGADDDVDDAGAELGDTEATGSVAGGLGNDDGGSAVKELRHARGYCSEEGRADGETMVDAGGDGVCLGAPGSAAAIVVTADDDAANLAPDVAADLAGPTIVPIAPDTSV